MTPPFQPDELKAELERALRFGIRSLERMICVNSVNYRATREGDGFVFTVKCIPDSRKGSYDLIVRHVRELEGTKAVRRLFEKECPQVFRGWHLLCLSWCAGGRVFPDALTSGQFRAFLDDYQDLSKALQRVTDVLPAYPGRQWRTEALAGCMGPLGGWLRRLIEEIPEGLSGFREERLQVTHGDLHPGNVVFDRGVVTGFLDLEGPVRGYPAWDIVRYFSFALTKTSPLSAIRRRRIWARFAEAVRHLPYVREDWIVSINVTWFEQLWKKNGRGRIGALDVLRLAVRARQYRRMREIVRREGRG